MNKRIKELAEQAQDWADAHAPYASEEQEYFAEKFALLIVQECLNQCYYRGMNDELYAGQLKAAAYIEQHFGVEG
jgi:hypothetical protein